MPNTVSFDIGGVEYAVKDNQVMSLAGAIDTVSISGVQGIETDILLKSGVKYVIENVTDPELTTLPVQLYVNGYAQSAVGLAGVNGAKVEYIAPADDVLCVYHGDSSSGTVTFYVHGLLGEKIDDLKSSVNNSITNINNSITNINNSIDSTNKALNDAMQSGGSIETLSISGQQGINTSIMLKSGQKYIIENATDPTLTTLSVQIYVDGYSQSAVGLTGASGSKVEYTAPADGALRVYYGGSSSGTVSIYVHGFLGEKVDDLISSVNTSIININNSIDSTNKALNDATQSGGSIETLDFSGQQGINTSIMLKSGQKYIIENVTNPNISTLSVQVFAEGYSQSAVGLTGARGSKVEYTSPADALLRVYYAGSSSGTVSVYVHGFLGEKVDDIANEFDWTDNIFDANESVAGGYYSNAGNYNESQYYSYNKILVNKGLKYTIKPYAGPGSQMGYVFADDGSKIGALSSYVDGGYADSQPSYSLTLPSNAGYFMLNTTVGYEKLIMVVKGSTPPSVYEQYGFTLPNLILNNNNVILTLKTDGTGDFTSLKSALAYAKTLIGKNVTIEVYPGTYDVCADFTADEINNASYYPVRGFVGLEVTDGIYIKGIGNRDTIILKGELSTTIDGGKREAISTLNLEGNCGIENLTVTSKYLRYAIHDDFPENVDSTHIVKNCRILNIRNRADDGRGTAYGMGSRSGFLLNMEDCVIEPDMVYHNNTSFSKADEINVINTKILGLMILNDANSTQHGTLNMVNSTCQGIAYANDGNAQCIFINGVGEADYPVFDLAATVVKLGNTDLYQSATALSAGHCVNRTGLRSVEKSTDEFFGVVIGTDDNGGYLVQKSGYVNSNKLGSTNTTGWEAGTLLKVGSDSYLTTAGSGDKAVAVVEFVENNVFYVKLFDL